MKIFVPILLMALAHLSLQDQIKSVNIKSIDKDTSELPINKSAKQCGGDGKFIVQHNSACKESTEEVCTFKHNNEEVNLETNFEPSKDFEKLAWRVNVKIEGKDTDWRVEHDAEVADSAVKKGQLTHLHSAVDPLKDLKGKFAGRYEIYDPADKKVELCVDVKFDAP